MWAPQLDHRSTLTALRHACDAAMLPMPPFRDPVDPRRRRPGLFAFHACVVLMAILLPGMVAVPALPQAAAFRLPPEEPAVKLKEEANGPERIRAMPWDDSVPEAIDAMPWELRDRFEPVEPVKGNRLPLVPPMIIHDEPERIRERPAVDSSLSPEPIRAMPQMERPEPLPVPPPPALDWELSPERIQQVTQPEEAPMFRTRPMTISTLALACCLAGSPALLAADDPKPGEIADILNKINRKLDDIPGMKAKLDTLENRLADLEKLPTQIENNTKSTRESLAEIKALRDEFTKIKNDMALLQSDMKRMQALADRVEKYQAFAPPNPPLNATVDLINAWTTPMIVVLDREIHRLEPGERKSVSRPGGEFKYEVLGVQGLTTRSVAAGKTFTIRIGAQ